MFRNFGLDGFRYSYRCRKDKFPQLHVPCRDNNPNHKWALLLSYDTAETLKRVVCAQGVSGLAMFFVRESWTQWICKAVGLTSFQSLKQSKKHWASGKLAKSMSKASQTSLRRHKGPWRIKRSNLEPYGKAKKKSRGPHWPHFLVFLHLLIACVGIKACKEHQRTMQAPSVASTEAHKSPMPFRCFAVSPRYPSVPTSKAMQRHTARAHWHCQALGLDKTSDIRTSLCATCAWTKHIKKMKNTSLVITHLQLSWLDPQISKSTFPNLPGYPCSLPTLLWLSPSHRCRDQRGSARVSLKQWTRKQGKMNGVLSRRHPHTKPTTCKK